MRVLVVIDRLTDAAGAEASTAIVIRGLQGKGFHFGVLTTGGDVLIGDRAELEGRGVVFREAPKALVPSILATRRFVAAFRPDVVHAVLFHSELVSRLALLGGPPVLGSIVSTQYSPEARSVARSPHKLEVVRHVDGLLARFATAHFHAVSDAAAREAQRSLGIGADRLTVVRRGRSSGLLGRRSEKRRRAARQALGIAADVPVVLTVSRHEPAKRLDLMFEAFQVASQAHPDAVLLVAGREGTTSSSLREVAGRLGLGDRLRFLGQRPDVPELLCAADVFAFSSTYEGLPGAVIESLALELPVVAFDIPPVREVVGDAGELVPVGDTKALAAAMVRVLEDAELATRLAEAGRLRFESMFTMTQYLDGFARLYSRVAQSFSTSGRCVGDAPSRNWPEA